MQDYPTTFVALDLETTGLNPDEDEIFEIGAVKVRDGVVVARFEEFAMIHRPLPLRIKRLTGIQDKDLQGKSSIHILLPKLDRFLEDTPLVLQNASFDLSFLEARGLKLRIPVYDTLEISRILLPILKNHKLKTLLDHFQIKRDQSHRAMEDAEGTGKIFLSLLHHLDDLESETLNLIVQLIRPTNWQQKDLFETALGRSIQRAPTRKKRSPHVPLPVNIIGSGRLKEKKEIESINPKEVEVFFEKGGILPTNLKGYESRREQVEMTKAVAQAFNEDHYLIAEAGTGTGKSLAYLIPSILWAYQNGQKVILSTNTKNLQDQLFYKDLPFLQRIMNKEFRVTLLKGRSNYLCLERWREVMRNPDLYLSTEDRIAILPLVLWIEETLTGDISENRGFHPDRNRGLWAKLTCPEREEKDTHKRCFLNRARDKAQKSHLVVVNHSLLLSDLATENRVLSSYSRLVLDEAHNLEKIATEHLGIEVNFYGLKRILDRLQEKGRRGLLSKFQSRIERGRFPRPTKESLLHQVETLHQIIPESQERGMTLFQKVSSLLSSKKQRYRPGDDFLQSINQEGEDILYTLTRLKSGLVSLGEELRDLKFSQTRIGTETLQDLEEVSQDLLHFINALNVLLLDLKEDYCYWAEARRDPLRTELHSVPIDVGTLLSEDLYKKMDSILFTSATLTVASSFDFFSNRTGISLLDPDRVTQISLGSSFSFDEQVRVLIPHYLPLPKSANFPKRIGETIQKVILSTKRGVMILTTSYDLLKFLDEQLRGELEENGIELLVQRRSGSRMGILEIFKEEKNSCLLGTNSFWEGVDVPGDALELLIMTKLPFPVPNEPIIEARCEALEMEGLDSFSNFMIPMAVIRLRQGFGRLIRTREDRGVVLLLDNRVSHQQYGQFFLNSLPVDPVICGSEEELMKYLSEFWR